MILTRRCVYIDMGWLRLVGSFKSQVSFAKEPYKRDDILQKRHTVLRRLLIVATPYVYLCLCMFIYVPISEVIRPSAEIYVCRYIHKICEYICIYIYMCVCMCIRVSMCLCLKSQGHGPIYIYVDVYIHTCIYTYMYIYIYVYIYICIFVCMYVYPCICV